MNPLKFSISVAILSLLVLIQNAHGSEFASGYTYPDANDYYKHDALISHYEGTCSGSIISNQHVLTAAHCVIQVDSHEIINISQKLIEVTVGIKAVNDPSSQIVRAVETIFLPNYFFHHQDPWQFASVIGDIAVLKLNRGIGLGTNPNIELLKLPSYRGLSGTKFENYYSARPLTTTGFGIRGRDRNDKAIPADYLYYSPAILLHDHKQCYYDGWAADYKLCVELKSTDYSFICGGDSGGALIDEATKEIIGVTSTGSRECDRKTLSTFTRVLPFRSAIEQALHDQAAPNWRQESYENNEFYKTKVSQVDPLHQPPQRANRYYNSNNAYQRTRYPGYSGR